LTEAQTAILIYAIDCAGDKRKAIVDLDGNRKIAGMIEESANINDVKIG
jgi:hypothetical protein